eukprot:PhF_6_TR17060/c1_g1_i1/m.26073
MSSVRSHAMAQSVAESATTNIAAPVVLSKSIRVTPAVAEFNDVETSLTFVIPFTIQNLSTVAKNVRFILPKTPVFKIINTPQVIAPGLKHTVELEFMTKAANDYHDVWSVITDDGRVDIPLHAVFPCPNLQVESLIDLGKVMVMHNVQPPKNVTVRNVGKKDGTFRVSYDSGLGLTVTPTSGVVKAGSSMDLKLDYFGSEVGVFRSMITLELDDNVTRRIDVTAEVIDARVSAVHPLTSEVITAVSFGTVFFGQKKQESVILVNNSPNVVSFTVHAPEDAENGNGDDESEANAIPIECSLTEGRIPAYGKRELMFTFQPVMAEIARGWGHQSRSGDELSRRWDPVFTVEIVETEQKIELQLVGKAFATEVSLSQSAFRFGTTPVNTHLEIMFQVQNDSTELPLLYSINRVAHFYATPSVARVPPKGVQNVVVSFHPNQLGRFRNYLTMTVNDGTRVLQLAVSGHAATIGEKAPPVGGIDKVPQDFLKQPNFVRAGSSPNLKSTANDGGSTDRKSQTTEDAMWAAEPDLDPNDILLLSEWEQKREHNKLYQRYLMNSRHNRTLATMPQGGLDNPDDLGMVPGEGLVPPEPKLQLTEDPLPWGGQGGRVGGAAGGASDAKKSSAMRGAASKFDEARVVKKKFKQTPSTLAEQRECKIALTPKEMQQISIPIKVIDFGNCSVYSKNTKPFFVHNDTKTHILVKIPVNIRDELAMSNPSSQVIPPGQTASFDIVFYSESKQKFQQAIYFTLNDNHKIKFGVFAVCEDIEVSLSQDDMTFRFTEFVLEPSLSQILTLVNSGNADAEVEWDLPAKNPAEPSPFLQNFAFSFKPEKCVIPANGSTLVEVTYTPVLATNESSNEVFLKVKGGASKKLILNGSVAPTTCSWSLKESKVDFKKVAVGSTRTQIISLRNAGQNSAVFTFDQTQLIGGLSVTPTRGRIQPNGQQEITIQLRALQPQTIRTTISCHIRGMKSLLKLLVFGEVKIPEFSMTEPNQEVIDFGGVYVGSSEFRKMEIQNHDDLSTTFFVDLTAYPEFSLYDADKRAVEASGADEDEGVSSGRAGSIAIVQQAVVGDDEESTSQAEHMASHDHDPDARHGNKYRITVNAQQTFHWFLCFSPSSVCHQDSYQLPLSLAGLDHVSDVVLPDTCNLNHIVTYSGRKPRLVMNPSMVDFGQRVVIRDGTSKNPNRTLIKLMNETDAELEWELDTVQNGLKELFGEIFRVEPTHGKLLSGQSAQVQFTFSPLDVKAYVMKVPVYLDGQRSTPYMEITVKGFGSNPGLSFDRKEVVLPVVPLNVPAKLTFTVINEGYESLDLKYRIPGDPKLIPLTLNFPEGQTVMSNKNQLPCEVTFVSSRPLAFSTVVDFIGDDGTIFPIVVTAGADSSIMTTYSYVKWRDSGMQFVTDGDKKGVTAKEVEDAPIDKDLHQANSKGDAASMISAQSVDDPTVVFNAVDKCHKKVLTKKAVDRLRIWLNTNVLADPIDDLITGLQSNHGRPIFDIIEVLYGKCPPGMIKAEKLSNNKRDAAMQELEQYNAVLSFLRQFGASISDVRPEFLIKYEDYCRVALPEGGYRSSTGTQAAVTAAANVSSNNSRTRVSERKFSFRSIHAWCTVLYQVARMFVVNKITWKAFRTMPQNSICNAVATAEKWNSQTPDPSVLNSNVYSVGESILLKWLSMHQSVYFPKESQGGQKNERSKTRAQIDDPSLGRGNDVRIVSFEDLRDSKAFASVLMGYVPNLIPRFDRARAEGFLLHPTTPGDYERNATITLDAMKEYGMDTKITPKDFIESNARDYILFSTYLFNTLPQYVPKTTIKFKGKLHEKIVKTIELSNPTKWSVDYQVILDGCDEFKIAESKLHLDARTSGGFSISVVPRFSKKIEARLTFLSNRVGSYSGATMVFQLETDVDTDSAMKTYDDLTTNLYDVLNYEMEVENPFNQHCHFSVNYTQERIRDGTTKPPAEQDSSSLFPEAFWTNIDTLNIKKGEKAKIQVQFLPFIRGKYKCKFMFCDEKAGEFAYYLVATCLPPKPFETMQIITEATQPFNKEVVIPLRHSAFDRAMQIKDERFKAFKGRKGPGVAKEPEVEPKEVTYTVEFVNEQFVGPNPFYQGPKTFTLKPSGAKPNSTTETPAAGGGGGTGGDAAEEAKKKKKDELDKKKWNVNATGFTFSLTPKGPGLYPCYLMLISNYDVRCIQIEGRSRSPGMKAELEFNCPARQQIVQEIPITNGSDREWVITATIQGEYFSGAKEIRVPAGRTRSYTLTFTPQWICEVQGQLVFRNAESGERYTYVLKGRADEPLAENTVPVECRAREVKKVTINVPNITMEEVTYAVETDLPFLQGEPKIVVNKMEVGKYQLTLNPQLSCKITGSVTFIAPNKQYSWYVLQVNVLRPPPEATIDIEATVRKAVAAEITISNPAKHTIDFAVRRRGDGLLGEDVVSLAPAQSYVYQLVFAPIKAGVSEGTISFYNDDVGEYWYKLVLTAKEAEPEQLAFTCELGKSKTAEVFIENPTDQECHLSVVNTNDANFIITPSTLVLRPNGALRAVVTYMPSAIHQEQSATLTISHPRAGAWVYQCKGKGTPPTKMEIVRVMSQVNNAASCSVVFRNPFPVPKKFIVSMVAQDTDSGVSVFSLLLKKAATSLGPFQILQVPLSYHPTLIAEHRATVIVTLVEGTQVTSDLKWEFPILGIAEALGTEQTIRISCKSRKEVTQTIDLPLVGLPIGGLARESFTHEVIVPSNSRYHRAVQSSVIVTLSPNQPPAGTMDVLRYDVVFCPLRPFSQDVELLLRKSSGGVWKYEIQLEATPPEVDDVINIAAGVHATQSVAFQLYNVFPQPKTFQAYFTADSAMELSVKPSRGTLPALEGAPQGQQFVVTFASASYGKTVTGTLIVDTDDIQWRYEVHGVLPKYVAPTEVTSRLDTYLSPEVQNRLSSNTKAVKRNYVKQNQGGTK